MKYLYKVDCERHRSICDREAELWLFITKAENASCGAEWSEDPDTLTGALAGKSYKNIMLTGFQDAQLEWLLPHVQEVEYLHLFKCLDLQSYSFLERLPKLQAVEIHWNRKAVALWDCKRNPRLQIVKIWGSNKLVDFSGLVGSSLERLEIDGCGSAGSFTPTLCIPDFSVFTKLPGLRELQLELKRNADAGEDLQHLAQLKQLDRLCVGESYFTFEQYAWLQAQLPEVDVVSGLYDYADEDGRAYSVIGRRMPRRLTDLERVEHYRRQFQLLLEKYRDVETPPV